jgi:hypothetical protein
MAAEAGPGDRFNNDPPNSATARISAVLALISRNFLSFISQKTGAARLLFLVQATAIR